MSSDGPVPDGEDAVRDVAGAADEEVRDALPLVDVGHRGPGQGLPDPRRAEAAHLRHHQRARGHRAAGEEVQEHGALVRQPVPQPLGGAGNAELRRTRESVWIRSYDSVSFGQNVHIDAHPLLIGFYVYFISSADKQRRTLNCAQENKETFDKSLLGLKVLRIRNKTLWNVHVLYYYINFPG